MVGPLCANRTVEDTAQGEELILLQSIVEDRAAISPGGFPGNVETHVLQDTIIWAMENN